MTFQHLYHKLLVCIAILLCISSCSMMQDDLADCPSGVQVKLEVTMDVEYGGKYSPQSFADDLKNITLWVFDENGVFIDKFREDGNILKQNNNTMNLPIEPGKYKMVVWTGAESSNYEVSAMIPGISTLEDLKVRVTRDVQSRQNGKLPSLWHGRIENAVVKQSEYTHLTIELTKNTNTIISVLHDLSGTDLNSDDYSFEIVANNGYMDYDNRLLPDDDITYNAYMVETALMSDDDAIRGISSQRDETILSVARAELSTLRLMADRSSRFIVKNKTTGVVILNINLTEYLLLTREYYTGSNGTIMSPQAYLDYEDIYRIVFFLVPTGNSASPYLCTTLRINGWVIRLNNAGL